MNDLKIIDSQFRLFENDTGAYFFCSESWFLLKFSFLLWCRLQKCWNGLLWTNSSHYIISWTCRWCLLEMLDAYAFMFEWRSFKVLNAVLSCYYATFPLDLCWHKIWNLFLLCIIVFSRLKVGSFLLNLVLLDVIMMAFWGVIKIISCNFLSCNSSKLFLRRVSCE